MWREIGDAVGAGTNDYDPEGQGIDVLLELEVAIERDEYVTDALSAAEEIAILDARPAEAVHG